MHEDLAESAESNIYTLRYLCAAPNGTEDADAAEKESPLAEASSLNNGRVAIEEGEGDDGDEDGSWGGAWVGGDEAGGSDADEERDEALRVETPKVRSQLRSAPSKNNAGSTYLGMTTVERSGTRWCMLSRV